MTGGEHTTESAELSERVLHVISSYGMGAALEARDLYPKADQNASSAVAAAHGVVSQVAGHERRTVGA